MQRILAIARLTWKSAFRYRLFWVMAALLVAAVVGLPLILKDDGTAEGLTQILLTYTLSAITVLLGIATLWLSCGTLARDVEDCQMQVVCTKPIGRWQVWLGKMAGILALNAMLLAISGTAVFMMLQWRSQRLPAEQQAKLRKEIFVARAAAKERPPDLNARAKQIGEQWLRDWRAKHPNESLDPEDLKQVSHNIQERVRADVEEVPAGGQKAWQINLSSLPARVRDQPMQLRVKFNVGDPNAAEGATYRVLWRIGPPKSNSPQVLAENLPCKSFQEIDIAPMVDEQGILTVVCANDNNTSLIFPMEDGFEVLYRESSFGVNFARGLAVILCWLALLSAIGLASASFLSFPVAAFCSLAVLLVGLSTGTLSAVQEQKSIFPYTQEQPGRLKLMVDSMTVPVFGAVLKVVNLVESFSPVDDLSTGHSITWGQLALAAEQIVLLMGGVFAVAGILLFNRRELAAVQANA
jgi:ABC-type transport system involved in multi-copper enzyme maturation permease subunit